MVFANGKVMVNGKVNSVKQCKKLLGQNVRILQKVFGALH